jgi:imidazolonepropionase-like amidohydrolase
MNPSLHRAPRRPEIFRMESEIGSVEPRKYADLLVVKGNPLKDLLIMKGGVAYKRTA